MSIELPHWAHVFGAPLCTAKSRVEPADFIVEEILDITVAGRGEHDLLHVRKTGANTAWVARQLGAHAGVREVDVGYAGLKDRNGVTSQWFSIHLPGRPSPEYTTLPGAEARTRVPMDAAMITPFCAAAPSRK